MGKPATPPPLSGRTQGTEVPPLLQHPRLPLAAYASSNHSHIYRRTRPLVAAPFHSWDTRRRPPPGAPKPARDHILCRTPPLAGSVHRTWGKRLIDLCWRISRRGPDLNVARSYLPKESVYPVASSALTLVKRKRNPTVCAGRRSIKSSLEPTTDFPEAGLRVSFDLGREFRDG